MSPTISVLNNRRTRSSGSLQGDPHKDFRLSLRMNRLLKKEHIDTSSNQNLNTKQVKLYIKNMVSLRCKMVVKEALEKLGLDTIAIDLGVVSLSGEMTPIQREQLKSKLHPYGLELLDDKKNILIERVKTLIIEMVHYSEKRPTVNISDYISAQIKYDYTYLSNIFSEMIGITIQQFIISHRIEKVKELLQYNELNLTEISYKLHYSSVSHLSNQFKKITGLSPSFYKQLNHGRNSNLENVGANGVVRRKISTPASR